MEIGAAIPTVEALRQAALDILKSCDLGTMSFKLLKEQLDQRFKVDLTSHKVVLKEAFYDFMQSNEDAIEYTAVVDEELNNASNEKVASIRKSKGGFGAPVFLAPELAQFLGEDVLARTEVTKRMWAYIKERGLQNAANKKEIVCDTKLEALFKRKKLDMFKMTKLLSKMMKSTADLNDLSSGATVSSVLKEEEGENEEAGEEHAHKPGSKKRKKTSKLASRDSSKKVKSAANCSRSTTGQKKDQSSFVVSGELCAALDIPPNETRFQVVSKMWEYIRANRLQNPADKREILLDERLRTVFRVERFTMFSMNKYIAQHMTRSTPQS